MLKGGRHGTELYRDVIKWKGYTNPELIRKVWEPTPYMIDVYTGGHTSTRRYEMREWLTERWGQACSPIHGREGLWQFGNATINGYTWLGFATKEMMQEFLRAWGEHPPC